MKQAIVDIFFLVILIIGIIAGAHYLESLSTTPTTDLSAVPDSCIYHLKDNE